MVEWQRDGKFSQNGKLDHSCARVTKSRFYVSWVGDQVIAHLGLYVSSFSIIISTWSMAVMLWQHLEYYC